MSYLICDKCGGYYELQSDESPDNPQNLRFWDPVNEVYEGFDSKCECGGHLRYVQNLNDVDDSQKVCPNCGSVNEDNDDICSACDFELKEPPVTKGKFQNRYPKGHKNMNWNWIAVSVAFVVALVTGFFSGHYLNISDIGYIGPLIGGFIAGYMVGKSYTNGIIYGGIPVGAAGFIGIPLLVLLFGSESSILSDISPGMIIIGTLVVAIIYFMIFSIIGSIGGILGVAIRKKISS